MERRRLAAVLSRFAIVAGGTPALRRRLAAVCLEGTASGEGKGGGGVGDPGPIFPRALNTERRRGSLGRDDNPQRLNLQGRVAARGGFSFQRERRN